MKKIGKRFLLLLAAVFFFGIVVQWNKTMTVAAEEASVYDDAGLLTSDEILELEAQAAALRELTGWEIFAVTTENAAGKSAMKYADDFFDARTEKTADGILALIDMDNREIYLSTSGKAIRYLTDTRIEAILDNAFTDVSEGDYAACLSAMLYGVENYYQKGIPKEQFNYDVETGAAAHYRSITGMEAVLVLFLSIGTGAAIYLLVLKRYSVKGSLDYNSYENCGKVNLTHAEDKFVHQTLTHQRIQTNQNNGSHGGGTRSSVHTSSAGRSHGGGGRKF